MTEDLNNSNISSSSSSFSDAETVPKDCAIAPIEKDFYGCYCLKFRVKHGTSITEQRIIEDFGAHGSVVMVWGAGVSVASGEGDTKPLDSVVYVWLKEKEEAKAALKEMQEKEEYQELTPALSDVLLPDNYGYYSISFKNMVSVPTEQIYREFSEFGFVRNVSGSLDTREGRVFISFREKEAATKAFIRKTERWYENMRFEFPKCERDYTSCYCLKFYNTLGSPNHATEEQVRNDFGKYGHIVDLRGPGLFETKGNDVYVRFREKASAQAALFSLVGKYSGLSITPSSEVLPDKYGWYSVSFVNKDLLSVQELHSTFQQFGEVVQVTGILHSPTGRVFVAFRHREGVEAALSALVASKQFKLQLCRPGRTPKPEVPRYYGPHSQHHSRERGKRKFRERQACRGRCCSREGDWDWDMRDERYYGSTSPPEGSNSPPRKRLSLPRVFHGRDENEHRGRETAYQELHRERKTEFKEKNSYFPGHSRSSSHERPYSCDIPASFSHKYYRRSSPRIYDGREETKPQVKEESFYPDEKFSRPLRNDHTTWSSEQHNPPSPFKRHSPTKVFDGRIMYFKGEDGTRHLLKEHRGA